jgi:hypothetical protein
MPDAETPVLKVFTDRSFLTPDRVHTQILIPFWGMIPEDEGHPKPGRFDRYACLGRQFFRITSLAESDIVVYPQEWEPGQRDAGKLGRLAQEVGKPLVIFFNSDSDENIPLAESVIFRTSFYRSRRKPNEYALPAWSEDIVARYRDGRIPVRKKGPHPVVSYCGYTIPPGSIARRIGRRLLQRGNDDHPGQRTRSRAIDLLKEHPGVKCNFLIRDEYWGGATGPTGFDPLRAERVRREFVENMFDGDYVVCARGGGNFSYRLYETLSCGRIPIFIDTDCVLPLEQWIDWKRYCVWVPEQDIDHIGDIVCDFHFSLSNHDFEEIQHACRRLWVEWISPEGFFGNLHRCFSDHGKS